jgi:hypothetical protein
VVDNTFIIRRSKQLNIELRNRRTLAELDLRRVTPVPGKVINFRRAS